MALLSDQSFDSEDIQEMSLAFESVCKARGRVISQLQVQRRSRPIPSELSRFSFISTRQEGWSSQRLDSRAAIIVARLSWYRHAYVRVYNCPGCHRERRLTVWARH